MPLNVVDDGIGILGAIDDGEEVRIPDESGERGERLQMGRGAPNTST